MMSDQPTISVIIPVYNGAEFVTQALDNVFSQGIELHEVIVVDDGSSDGSCDVVRAYPAQVTLIEQENAGPGAARNTGIKAATGAFVAFLDVDDLWPEGKLQRQIDVMQDDPSLSLVLGVVQHVNEDGAETFEMQFEDEDNKTIPFFHFGAGLYRMDAFSTVGLISEELKDSEDHDWFIRLKEAGLNWLVENDVGLIYRRHFTNMTQPGPLHNTELFKVLALSLKRRRGADGTQRIERLTDRRAEQPQEGGDA